MSSNECVDCLEGACRPSARAGWSYESLLKQLVASSVGSAAAVVALNPVSVIKVHLQSEPAATSSIRHVVSRILSEKGGLRGFWSGTPVGLLQAVPNTILYMSIYENLKVTFASSLPPAYSSVSPGLAGGCARVVCVSLMSPLEVLRTIQTGGARGSALDIMRGIHRQCGFRGFYRGWNSTIARDAPYSAIYWFAFDLLRPLWETQVVAPPPPPLPLSGGGGGGGGGSSKGVAFSNTATFAAGASASALAALCTHPFDVLKTRAQLGAAFAPPSPSPALSVQAGAAAASSAMCAGSGVGSSGGGGVGAGLAALYGSGGVRALYRGLSMRLATVIPGSTLVVTVYEFLKANL